MTSTAVSGFVASTSVSTATATEDEAAPDREVPVTGPEAITWHGPVAVGNRSFPTASGASRSSITSTDAEKLKEGGSTAPGGGEPDSPKTISELAASTTWLTAPDAAAELWTSVTCRSVGPESPPSSPQPEERASTAASPRTRRVGVDMTASFPALSEQRPGEL